MESPNGYITFSGERDASMEVTSKAALYKWILGQLGRFSCQAEIHLLRGPPTRLLPR